MNAYKFSYLIWLLPAYLLFLCLHQTVVLYSLSDTYNNGTSLIAEIVEFNTKQIGAQTSGHVILQFETKQGESMQRYLSLPFEIVRNVSQSNAVPIRYQKGAFIEIVLMPSYQTQKNFVLTNLAMAVVGLLITLFIALKTQRYANKKMKERDKKLVIERVD